MTTFYVYPLSLEDYQQFLDNFPDIERRNEGFRIIESRHTGWLDPPDFENRRRLVITPRNHEVIVLVKSGRDDWEFVRWLARNEIPMDPPLEMYLW